MNRLLKELASFPLSCAWISVLVASQCRAIRIEALRYSDVYNDSIHCSLIELSQKEREEKKKVCRVFS